MATDFTRLQIERTRAEHDESQRQAQISEIAAKGKPSADAYVTYDEATELVKLFEYEDGEQVGLLPTGRLDGVHGTATERVIAEDGQAVVAAGHHRILEPVFKPKLIPKNGRGWTTQRDRPVKGYEKS